MSDNNDNNNEIRGSLKNISDSKLVSFVLGQQKKSRFQKQREEQEMKKKLEEQESAKVYESFVASFGDSKEQAFVKQGESNEYNHNIQRMKPKSEMDRFLDEMKVRLLFISCLSAKSKQLLRIKATREFSWYEKTSREKRN